jgi:flagellar basal-body rod protein FlgC
MAAIEALFTSMDISASGLSAQRRRMDLIANNIANAQTTRTAEGGPYKRKDAVLTARIDPETGKDFGVDIKEIITDPTAPRMIYDPGHPDANKEGFVAYPNVSVVTEMVNMLQVTRAYEANVTALTAAKEMINKSFEITTR